MAQSPRQERAQPNEPSESMTKEGEGNTVYKPIDSKEFQLRDHKAVSKIDEDGLHQDWCQEIEITEFYVQFKDEFL